MYEEAGKLIAVAPLMFGLAVAMIGISNNPDQGITYNTDTGISEPAGTQNTETISSHRSSDTELQTMLDSNQEKKKRSKKKA